MYLLSLYIISAVEIGNKIVEMNSNTDKLDSLHRYELIVLLTLIHLIIEITLRIPSWRRNS